jgi:hypothetical protein
MQLAPLRPRRRRTAGDPISTPHAPSASTRLPTLSAVAERIAGLIDGPVSEALVVMLTELYGDALARVIAAIEAAPDGAAILERMCADKLVGGLLVVHDLHPQPLAVRVERALAALAPTLGAPLSVTLDRIEDDVVYIRLAAPAGSAERSAIAHAVAEAAPEIICVRAEFAVDGGLAAHA